MKEKVTAFGRRMAKALENWSDNNQETDATMEFLHDHKLLNEEGEDVAHAFWWLYIREKRKR